MSVGLHLLSNLLSLSWCLAGRGFNGGLALPCYTFPSKDGFFWLLEAPPLLCAPGIGEQPGSIVELAQRAGESGFQHPTRCLVFLSQVFPAAGRGEHIFSSDLYVLLGIPTGVERWLEMPRANSQDNPDSTSRSEEK